MVQTPIIFDVKTQPKTLRTSTGSKDLQTVNLTLRVLFRKFINQHQKYSLFSILHILLYIYYCSLTV